MWISALALLVVAALMFAGICGGGFVKLGIACAIFAWLVMDDMRQARTDREIEGVARRARKTQEDR